MTHIRDLFSAEQPTLSFEFFPPKTDSAKETLLETLDTLTPVNPSFVSVTYGAMGSTRDTTKDIVIDLCKTKPFPAMAHLTCVGHKRQDLVHLLDEYAAAGVDNILALSGDLPTDVGEPGEFNYALELVELVREHPYDFCVGVAAHPEIHPRSKDLQSDRKYLAEKLELADFAITQFFFYAKYYFQLVEEIAELGIHKPIIPGVIPVMNTKSVMRFSKMNNVDVDKDFFNRLDSLGSKEEADHLAIAAAYDLIQELLEGGAPGIHIYTLNQALAGLEIAHKLQAAE